MDMWLRATLHLVILLGIAQLTWCEYPEWEEPHAWAQRRAYSSGVSNHKNDDVCNCRSQLQLTSKNSDNLPFLYKKIVKFLLNRDKMKFDGSSKLYYRSLHLHIAEDQLDRFEKMTDVDDIDQLIAEVLHQSGGGTIELFKEMYLTWRDTFLYYWQWLQSSRQIIIGMQFAFIVLIWFASRKFKFSFRTVAVFCIVFYLYSLLDAECHRKKEIEKAAEMFGMQKENPCKATPSFWNYYFGNTNAECQKYLKKTYDESCTLVDIYEEFVNIFVYKQIWNFVDNSVGNIFKIYSTHGIISAILVTLICVMLFNNYIKLTIVSTFKYIMAPSTQSSTHSITEPNRQQIDNGGGDRLSGENLKKILDIMQSSDHARLRTLAGVRTIYATSGIQEIDVVDSNEGNVVEKLKIEKCESSGTEKIRIEESEQLETVEDVTSTNGVTSDLIC